MIEIVAAINSATEHPLPETRLTAVFERWWPELDEKLRAIREGAPPSAASAPDHDQSPPEPPATG